MGGRHSGWALRLGNAGLCRRVVVCGGGGLMFADQDQTSTHGFDETEGGGAFCLPRRG